MKTLTKDAVADCVQGIKGATTSLDVKNHLRQAGYWAEQHQVSAYLQELCREGLVTADIVPDWMLYSSEPFNYYMWNHNATNVVTTNIDDVKETQNPASGDWFLFAYTDPNNKIYVVGDVDRNVARAYYEKVHNVAYFNVACNRVQ